MQAAINPSIAFSLINSHEELRWNWHREMKGSFLIPPLLSFHSPWVISFSLPGDVFGCEQQLETASASIYPHHYPHLPLLPKTHRAQSPISSPQDDTLTSGKCCHVITEEQQRRDAKTRWTVVVRVTAVTLQKRKITFVKKWLYRKSEDV